MSNIFGMDIRRFSVLFIATIIILSIFASFRDLQNIQQTYNTTISTSNNNITSENSPNEYSFIYNESINLSPNINDLKYVYGSFANTQPPNYTLSLSNGAYVPILFNLSIKNTSLLDLLINYLSRNASEITPSTYGELLSIASSGYTDVLSYQNTTVRPFPLNTNDTENYSKYKVIIYYAKDFTVPAGFQLGWSYPPSDNISYHDVVTKIVNTYTVTAYVVIKYSISYYLVNEYRTGSASCYGGHIYIHEYYDAQVNYEFCYYLNDNGTTELYAKIVGEQTIPYTGGSVGPLTETTSAPVPGNTTSVQATAGLLFTEQETEQTSSYTQHCRIGNRTVVSRVYVTTYEYRPVLNTVIDISNTYIFYEYSVAIPLQITVLNGTNPTTYIEGSSLFTSSGRVINTNISYLVWSSSPKQYHVSIKTNDSINVGGLQINREWNAGTLQIVPELSLQTLQSGNDYIHNYYLNFNIDSKITEPPSWIYEKMTYNKYATIDYFYLEQNASLAAALMNYIKSTVNQSDTQYIKFEYFTLIAQYVTEAYNGTLSYWDNFLELASLGNISWALAYAKILNLSAYPNLSYMTGYLQFFNVSRIPQIYNVSYYLNITGNNQVYMNDVYNVRYWNNVTFGNPYSFDNISFYLVQSKQIPYVNEELDFYDTDFIPSLFYAVFTYSNPEAAQITAIWNGTAWIS